MRSAKALQQLKGKEEEKLWAALLLALVVKKKRSAAALFCFGSSDEVSPHDSAGHWTITGPSSDEQPTSTSWLVRSQRYSMSKSLPVWWRQRLQAPLLGGASKASFSRPSRAARMWEADSPPGRLHAHLSAAFHISMVRFPEIPGVFLSGLFLPRRQAYWSHAEKHTKSSNQSSAPLLFCHTRLKCISSAAQRRSRHSLMMSSVQLRSRLMLLACQLVNHDNTTEVWL